MRKQQWLSNGGILSKVETQSQCDQDVDSTNDEGSKSELDEEDENVLHQASASSASSTLYVTSVEARHPPVGVFKPQVVGKAKMKRTLSFQSS